MPVLGPVQTDGVRFQSLRTTMRANGSFKVGDLGVVVRASTTNSSDAYTNLKRIESPLDLMKMLGLALENAVAGQDFKVLLCGDMDSALCHFASRVEHDQPLVANVAGALSTTGKPGNRIIAYSRAEVVATTVNRPERFCIPVFFDGVTGFGPLQ